jgi:hypothetical protein
MFNDEWNTNQYSSFSMNQCSLGLSARLIACHRRYAVRPALSGSAAAALCPSWPPENGATIMQKKVHKDDPDVQPSAGENAYCDVSEHARRKIMNARGGPRITSASSGRS